MIREKMEAHGLPHLDFPVVSDPSWSMMVLEPRAQIFMENPSHTDLQKAEFFDQEYRMVQPALAVVDSSGDVVYWWSWNKLASGRIAEDELLPNRKTEDNPTGNTHDVRFRVNTDDLLHKLQGETPALPPRPPQPPSPPPRRHAPHPSPPAPPSL